MTTATTTTEPTTTAPRRVIYLDETMLTPDGWQPSIVTENEPGHTPTNWLWGHDFAAARRIAADSNAQLGHSHTDVLMVIASSIRASATD